MPVAAILALIALVAAGTPHPALAESSGETDLQKLIFLNCRRILNAPSAYQNLCATSLQQGVNQGNAPFLMRLETIFQKCIVGNVTSIDNRRAAFELKPAIEWTMEDLATIHRYATNCLMRSYPQKELAPSLYETGTEVLRTYGDDIATAKSSAKQAEARKAAEDAEAEVLRIQAESRRKAEAHRIMLAEQGYTRMSLLELKARAADLVGTKVAVNGLLQIFQNDMAYLGTRQDDMTGVIVSIKDVVLHRRMDLLSRCSQFARPCRTEIIGKVITSKPSVLIDAD